MNRLVLRSEIHEHDNPKHAHSKIVEVRVPAHSHDGIIHEVDAMKYPTCPYLSALSRWPAILILHIPHVARVEDEGSRARPESAHVAMGCGPGSPGVSPRESGSIIEVLAPSDPCRSQRYVRRGPADSHRRE